MATVNIDNTRSRGKFRRGMRLAPQRRLSRQEGVAVSYRGRTVEATSAGVCERCGEPYEAGEAIGLLVPQPGSQKAWDRAHETCAPRLAKPRKWKFEAA